MGDNLKKENERLRAELDDQKAKYAKIMKAFERPGQILAEKDELAAKVKKFSTDIKKLRARLDALESDRTGAKATLGAVDEFLSKLGLEARLRWPLFKLYLALEDADLGISNPITAKSKKVGQPLPSLEVVLKTQARLAVLGLRKLGKRKGETYDIVSAAAGLPRDQLVRLCQSGKAGDRGPAQVRSHVGWHVDTFWSMDGDWDLGGIEFSGMTPEKLQTEVNDILDRLSEMRDLREIDRKAVTAPTQ